MNKQKASLSKKVYIWLGMHSSIHLNWGLCTVYIFGLWKLRSISIFTFPFTERQSRPYKCSPIVWGLNHGLVNILHQTMFNLARNCPFKELHWVRLAGLIFFDPDATLNPPPHPTHTYTMKSEDIIAWNVFQCVFAVTFQTADQTQTQHCGSCTIQKRGHF